MDMAAASAAGSFGWCVVASRADSSLSPAVVEDNWFCCWREVAVVAVVKRVAMLPVIGLKIVAALANSCISRSHSSFVRSAG